MALDDLKAANAALQAELTRDSDVTSSAVTLIQTLNQRSIDLAQQLADAIANGNDPAAVQEVLDGMNANNAAIKANTDALAAAVAAGTNP